MFKENFIKMNNRQNKNNGMIYLEEMGKVYDLKWHFQNHELSYAILK